MGSRGRYLRSVSSRTMAPPVNVLKRPFFPITRRFTFGQELGRGISGIVRECKEISTGLKFACKSISKLSLDANDALHALRSEVATMEVLRSCREVVELYCSFEDNQSVHLVMEICRGGDLAARLEKEGHLSEEETAHVCISLTKSIMHFHREGVIHRDLKPENILLCSPQAFSEVRVADFGVAKFLPHGDKLDDIVGSPYYMAPEMLRGEYSFEVDIWSLGVILFTLLSGKLPFFHPTDEGIFRSILRGKYKMDTLSWKSVSPSAKNLVSRMLVSDPSMRITPIEILNHPWILSHLNSISLRISTDDDLPVEGNVTEEETGGDTADEDAKDVAVAIPVAPLIPITHFTPDHTRLKESCHLDDLYENKILLRKNKSFHK